MSIPMNQTVYGNTTTFLVLVKPDDGWVTPPDIGGLPRLGAPYEIFTFLSRTMKQAAIADLVGVSQQQVSRYINGETAPRLSSEVWKIVIAAYLAVSR